MSSSHMSCTEGHGGEFWLLPDGAICCADDDCHARFPARWVRSEDEGTVPVIREDLHEALTLADLWVPVKFRPVTGAMERLAAALREA